MSSDWANLQKEILHSVVQRLDSTVDFSFVCKPWHSTAKDTRSHCAITTVTPLLLISQGKQNIWNLYNSAKDELLRTQVNLPNLRFCGSSKGWLILIDDKAVVHLINPFFRVKGRREKENSTISLPPLNPPNRRKSSYMKKHYDHFVYKATISADPLLNPNNCSVVVIHEEKCQLAFIRLNKDKKWTFIADDELFEEVVQFGGKFYAIAQHGRLFCFDIIPDQSIINLELAADGVESNDPLCSIKNYLVVSNENKLSMLQRYIRYGYSGRATKMFRVFEYNSERSAWIEKETLGGAALFVGDNSTISVLASKLGCRPNCIYFSSDYTRIVCRDLDYGMYNVEDRCISNPYTTAISLVKNSRRAPIWVVPTYST